MKLKYYASLEEKRDKFLKYEIINTQEEFTSLSERFETFESNKKEHYLFRGVNNSSYQLYSSAQRLWIGRGLDTTGLSFRKLIASILREAKKKNEILSSYLARLGIVQNDWLILSFLQHYGAATPFIDFSRRYKIALYFAFDNMNSCGGNDIDEYVSIYYYKTVDVARDIAPSVYRLAINAAQHIQSWEEGLSIWSDLSYSKTMAKHPLVLVPAYSRQSDIYNDKKKKVSVYTVANLNSTAQEGEFICNSSPDKPLEDAMICNNKRYLSCVEIHKGLYEYILKKYLRFPDLCKAKELYYPDEKDVAAEVMCRALSSKNTNSKNHR